MDKQTDLLSDIFYDMYNSICKKLESKGKLPENRKSIHEAVDNALYDYISKINQVELIDNIVNQLS